MLFNVSYSFRECILYFGQLDAALFSAIRESNYSRVMNKQVVQGLSEHVTLFFTENEWIFEKKRFLLELSNKSFAHAWMFKNYIGFLWGLSN